MVRPVEAITGGPVDVDTRSVRNRDRDGSAKNPPRISQGPTPMLSPESHGLQTSLNTAGAAVRSRFRGVRVSHRGIGTVLSARRRIVDDRTLGFDDAGVGSHDLPVGQVVVRAELRVPGLDPVDAFGPV